MILIFGPHNSRYTYTGSLCPHNDLAYEIEASQIKDAIRLYEEKFNVKITPSKNTNNPENEYKYFDYLDNLTNNIHLVDLHVIRSEVSICVKQNLNFNLQENDMIEMGTLIC